MIKDNGIRSNISKEITFLHLFLKKVSRSFMLLSLQCVSLASKFHSFCFILFCFFVLIPNNDDHYNCHWHLFYCWLASYIFEYCSFFIHWLNRMQINKSTHELWDKRKFLKCSRFYLFASIVRHEKTICERFKL